ncbi:hypothetical protein N7533_010618 [Penicillium manginii]|uniref:uncharacterized protein n=1 Tax=Penicillium manginii TaxID=203109 RepID=UPI002549758A|nr:uncharacterized protein N7533_010618 [Penicillium manginii]KAJ5743516.1 hypothetical protein N7533_010618 [Penicillium manginii]
MLYYSGAGSREDWIEVALESIGYEFSMLQLERNNLASMLQLYEQDMGHLDDCIQHVEEIAKQRNGTLIHKIEDLEARLAVGEVPGKNS